MFEVQGSNVRFIKGDIKSLTDAKDVGDAEARILAMSQQDIATIPFRAYILGHTANDEREPETVLRMTILVVNSLKLIHTYTIGSRHVSIAVMIQVFIPYLRYLHSWFTLWDPFRIKLDV